MKLYWAVLLDPRFVPSQGVDSLLDVAQCAVARGYERMKTHAMRTDAARNNFALGFLNLSKDPNDALVMLDNDHCHPCDILHDLASAPVDKGIVCALTYRRTGNHQPLMYVRQEGTDQVEIPLEWEKGYKKCVISGHGAILIRRWVFEKLIEKNEHCPWWKYSYVEDQTYFATEDTTFGLTCERSGIYTWVDTRIVCPHVGVKFIDDKDFREQLKATGNNGKFDATNRLSTADVSRPEQKAILP